MKTEICQVGNDEILGASVKEEGVNFAIYAPLAEELWLTLCLAEPIQFLLHKNHRTGIWHGLIKQAKAKDQYLIHTMGPYNHEKNIKHNPNKYLLDPRAKVISHRPRFHTSLISHQMLDPALMDQHNNYPYIPKAVISDDRYQWQDVNRPNRPLEQSVIYEAHVKGTTYLHPSIEKNYRGTFLGLVSPIMIEHFKKLNITTIQLMPVHASISEQHLAHSSLRNYWGYNPISFFALEPTYAFKDALVEFKTMVDLFHQHDIEVILDVVYNHTGEAGLAGPTLNHKGLDGQEFYKYDHEFINFTGCGNTVNIGSTNTLKLVLDSMRYWVEECHIDGFRFDLAVTLGRDEEQFNPQSAFFKAIHQDPVLSKVKLIAEPWDLGPNGYQLGKFMPKWFELNDRYRDQLRGMVLSKETNIDQLKHMISGKINDDQAIRSINFITYHDGFCLLDLVSFDHKHNHANGEENRDGHNHNLSSNNGFEGFDHQDENIDLIRLKQRQNLAILLAISKGALHWLGGDEIERTHMGNNNVYCQDNELNWFDWQLTPAKQRWLEFCQKLFQLRASTNFIDNWLNPNHHIEVSAINLEENPHSALQAIVFGGNQKFAQRLLINLTDTPVNVTLEALGHWQVLIDTHQGGFIENTPIIEDNSYHLWPSSMALIQTNYKGN